MICLWYWPDSDGNRLKLTWWLNEMRVRMKWIEMNSTIKFLWWMSNHNHEFVINHANYQQLIVDCVIQTALRRSIKSESRKQSYQNATESCFNKVLFSKIGGNGPKSVVNQSFSRLLSPRPRARAHSSAIPAVTAADRWLWFSSINASYSAVFDIVTIMGRQDELLQSWHIHFSLSPLLPSPPPPPPPPSPPGLKHHVNRWRHRSHSGGGPHSSAMPLCCPLAPSTCN